MGLDVLLRSYLVAPIDRVPFSTVWISICGVFVSLRRMGSAWDLHTRCEETYGCVSTLPDRFGDAVDRASHPALRHPTSIRRHCATRSVAVDTRATVSTVHHVVEHVATLEREAHPDEWVVKEATLAAVVRIVAAVPTPRVMEKWVRHGMVHFAEDGLEKSKGICEAGMMRPWIIKGIVREGHILFPAGVMVGAAMMARAL